MVKAETNKKIKIKGEEFDDIINKDRALIMAIQELTNAIERLRLNG